MQFSWIYSKTQLFQRSTAYASSLSISPLLSFRSPQIHGHSIKTTYKFCNGLHNYNQYTFELLKDSAILVTKMFEKKFFFTKMLISSAYFRLDFLLFLFNYRCCKLLKKKTEKKQNTIIWHEREICVIISKPLLKWQNHRHIYFNDRFLLKTFCDGTWESLPYIGGANVKYQTCQSSRKLTKIQNESKPIIFLMEYTVISNEFFKKRNSTIIPLFIMSFRIERNTLKVLTPPPSKNVVSTDTLHEFP